MQSLRIHVRPGRRRDIAGHDVRSNRSNPPRDSSPLITINVRTDGLEQSAASFASDNR